MTDLKQERRQLRLLDEPRLPVSPEGRLLPPALDVHLLELLELVFRPSDHLVEKQQDSQHQKLESRGAVMVAKWLEQRSHNLEVPSSDPPGARAFSLLLSMAECT